MSKKKPKDKKRNLCLTTIWTQLFAILLLFFPPSSFISFYLFFQFHFFHFLTVPKYGDGSTESNEDDGADSDEEYMLGIRFI
jgi:hypothetical protein